MDERSQRTTRTVRTVRAAHVLAVNDDPNLRELFREVLQNEGYAVTLAHHGVEALAILRQSALPHLVLLDDLMPSLDGAGVLACVASGPALANLHRFIFMIIRASALPEEAIDECWVTKAETTEILEGCDGRDRNADRRLGICGFRCAHDHSADQQQQLYE